MPPMAMTATFAGEVPESASCSATASDAMKMESQPATKPLTITPHGRSPVRRRRV